MANDNEEIPDWRVRLFVRLGVPTSALILIGISFYRMAQWTGEHVVSPIVTRQVQALATMEELLKSAEKYGRDNHTLINQNTATLHQQHEILKSLNSRLESLEREHQRQPTR